MKPVDGRPGGKALSVRAVVLGLVVIASVNVWIACSEHLLGSSRMNLSHLPLALFVTFLVLTIPLNLVLKLVSPRFAFSSSELLVVLTMGLAAAAVPASGLTDFLLGVIATPFYFASPENRWGEFFLPSIPSWLAPRDEGGAMKLFFEGLPEGQRLPWEVWVVPLFWWLSLVAAIILVSVSLAVILRKQWSEQEKLAYPLVTVAREMVVGAEERQLLPTFVRGKLFSLGFACSFVILTWNVLPWFWPAFPSIPVLGQWRTVHPDVPALHNRINFLTIGICYFAHPHILLSIWVFHLVFLLQAMILNRVGFTIGGIEDQWSSHDAATSWLHFGAFFFLVVAMAWTARRHLRNVVSKAFALPPGGGDDEEMLSYRTAVWSVLLGVLYICFWFHRAGMGVALVVLFVLGTLVIHIGVAYIVAKSGLPYVRGPLSAQSFAVYLVGGSAITPAGFTALAFSYALIANGRGLFMPALVHSAKLGEFINANKRRLCVAVLAGLGFGILVSVGFSIYLGYSRGALNFQSNVFSYLSQSAFEYTLPKMQNPFPRSWVRIELFGVGALVTAVLSLLSMRLAWWPLHPIGFAISSTYLTRFGALSIFIAWLAKTIILRMGGVGAYRTSKPFFLGLLTGYAFGVAVANLVDAIWFPGQGHQIHSW